MAVGFCDECRRVYVYSASEDAMCHACQNELSDVPEDEMDGWIAISVVDEHEAETPKARR